MNNTKCNKITDKENCLLNPKCHFTKKKCRQKRILSLKSKTSLEQKSLSKSTSSSLEQKDPCKEKERVELEIKELNTQKMQYNEDCNKQKYLTIEEEDKITTLLDLVKFIFRNKIGNYQELFAKFPESNERSRGFYSKPYIFEALWKIIFLLKLDDLTGNYKREYFKSIENREPITEYDYLNSKDPISRINSGSTSGIADFYFEIVKDNEIKKPNKPSNACEKEEFKPKIEDVYLFTSKFYRSEKGLGNYDIPEIALNAKDLLPKTSDISFKIVTLVKNGTEFRKRIDSSSKEVLKSYIHSDLILDEYAMDTIYYPRLYNWIEEKIKDIETVDWEKAITGNPTKIINIVDHLRFHQKYVVEYTNSMIEDEQYRFIWGAVARSGKSYMVGGLVAKRKPRIVLLILGAVTETKNQFINDLFQKYTDLKEYEVIDFQNSTDRKKEIKKNKKYVFVISQDNLRSKISNDYDNTVIEKIKEVLKEKEKIVFFDEIHQGSGTNSMQEKTIQFFYNEEYPKPIFIMVTATYGKLAKYGKNIDGNDSILIEWNYDMIMKMKTFSLERVTILPGEEGNHLIERRSDHFERKMNLLKEITEREIEKGKTVEDIAYEYDSNPELVYLLPTLKEGNYKITEEGEEGERQLNIKENIKEILQLKKNKEKAFQYPNAVNKLLSYINDSVYNELLYKEYNYIANGEGQFHSQLWFLPTSMKTEGKHTETNEDRSIVAPMSKNLAKAIVEHPKFTNFNVCVIHSSTGQITDYYKEYISVRDKSKNIDDDKCSKVYFTCIKKKNNIKECIKDIEIESKKNNKSLIILTAKQLRLGISLPCVDIAIHLDNIKSYDIIYQSMFRVLTERSGKKQGFFVDMILDRAIQFFYKYTKHQKNVKNMSELSKEEVRQNLLLFDVGSIQKSIGFTNIQTPVNTYATIAETFKIDSDEHFEAEKRVQEEKEREEREGEDGEYIEPPNEIESNIKEPTERSKKNVIQLLNVLNKNPETEEKMKEILKNIHITKTKGQTKKKKTDTFKANVELPEIGQTELNEEESLIKEELLTKEEPLTEEENIKKKFDTIVKNVTGIFTLMVLFKGEDSTLDDINKTNLDFDAIKKCENDDIIKYCYIISVSNEGFFYNPDNISDDSIQKKIDIQVDIIQFLKENQTEKKEINNLFSNIKEEMKDLKPKIEKEKQSFEEDSRDFCPSSFIQDENVMEIIRKYLTPKKEEKDAFGEVFTPLELVCDMLSHLPEDVWTNKDLKWLDPANGIGNFPVVVYYKLMQTLESVPKARRSKHIIENMLYMNELNPVNIALSKKIFKMIDPDATPNIKKGDFLQETENIEKYNIIIGNPPYNQGGSNKGGGVFWIPFVKKSVNLLEPDGYLSFVHPLGWRKPSGERESAGDVWNKIFKEGKLLFLKINDIPPKNFPKVDYYIWQNSTNSNSTNQITHVINEFNGETTDERLKLYHLPFIPHVINKTVISILDKILADKGDRFDIYRKQDFKPDISNNATSGTGYTTMYDVNNKEYKIKYMVKTQEDTNKYINEKKIIMTHSTGNKPAELYPMYYSKPIGSSANTMYYILKPDDDIKSLLFFFDSKLIHFLLKITQYSSSPNHKNEFKILNLISKPTISIEKEEDVYRFYGLTRDEIDYIETFLTKIEKKPSNRTQKNRESKPVTQRKKSKPLKPSIKQRKSKGGKFTKRIFPYFSFT